MYCAKHITVHQPLKTHSYSPTLNSMLSRRVCLGFDIASFHAPAFHLSADHPAGAGPGPGPRAKAVAGDAEGQRRNLHNAMVQMDRLDWRGM
jgi:hypothetical protein